MGVAVVGPFGEGAVSACDVDPHVRIVTLIAADNLLHHHLILCPVTTKEPPPTLRRGRLYLVTAPSPLGAGICAG